MESLQTQNVKFAKGDSLDAIAKKHGVKADGIWKYPDNKKIVQTRGKPDKLQPGDLLVIPPSEKAVQAARKSLDDDIKVVEAELARVKKRAAALDRAEHDIIASVDDAKKQLKAQASKIQSASNAVDLAAIVISLGRIISGAMKKGLSAVDKIGEELEEHTKDVQKDAIKLAYSPFKDVSVKVVGGSAASSNEAVLLVQTAVQSFDKMTSPSFWTNTAYQLASGKNWSDAVNTQVTKDLDDRVDEMEAVEASQLNKLKRMRAGVLSHEHQLEAAVKQLQAIAKDIK